MKAPRRVPFPPPPFLFGLLTSTFFYLLATPFPPPLIWPGVLPTAPRRLPLPPPTLVWILTRMLRHPPLLPMHTARRQRSDVGKVAVRRHETRRSTVSEWQSSTPLEPTPRHQIPVPSRGGRRRIRLSGDVVDQGVSQILRRCLVSFSAGKPSFLRLGSVLGGRWFRGGAPERLTTVAHRRAEFLRPSPSVHIRGLRCVGVGRSRGEGVSWGEREE